ncbi:MAG: hypothetical protein ACK4K9_07775 [Bacteroidia bacterium]
MSGISMPTALYGSKDVTLTDAGFALNGIGTSIFFEDTRKPKWINYNLAILQNVNKIDETAIEKFANGSNLNGNKINIQATVPWRQFFIGGGPKVNAYKNGYTLYAGILAGLNFLSSAAYNRFDTSFFFKQKSSNTTSFGILFNAGTNVNITQSIAFTLQASYYYTSANYGSVVITDANGVVLQLPNQPHLQVPVQTILVQTGLTFNLSNNSKNFLKKE